MVTEKKSILSKVIDPFKKLDNDMSSRSWFNPIKSIYYIPKGLGLLAYHASRGWLHLAKKGAGNTWKEDIRPKIPFGDPDVAFDLKEHKSTKKDYGVSFAPITKKKGHEKDVIIQAPRYVLSYGSIKKFGAWLESSEDDEKDPKFSPERSDKIGIIDILTSPVDSFDNAINAKNEDEAYKRLIDAYNFLKENGGSIKVMSVSPEGDKNKIVIEIDVGNKTLDQIKGEIEQCFDKLGLPRDSKMIETAAKRLYDGARNQAISSDKPFTKLKQELPQELPQEHVQACQNLDQEETIEEANIESSVPKSKGLSHQNSERIDQASKAEKNEEPSNETQKTGLDEQIESNMPNSVFSLSNPQVFPNVVNPISSPVERQGELISHYRSSNFEISKDLEVMDRKNIARQVKKIIGEDSFSDISVNSPSRVSSPQSCSVAANRINNSNKKRGIVVQ